MRNNQYALDELAGKTIRKVFCDYSSQILLVFNDGSCCVICADDWDDESVIQDDDFRLSDWSKHAVELQKLGVISHEQFIAHKAEQQQQADICRERRRKEFEALKAEFEST